MRSIAKPFRSYLRAALLALLVLGLLVRPVLIGVGQVHEVEHAVFSDGNHAHGSADDHHGDGAPQGNPDHATGSHSLMHHHGGAVADVSCPAPLCAAQGAGLGDFAFPGSAVPSGRCSGPFRPPIV